MENDGLRQDIEVSLRQLSGELFGDGQLSLMYLKLALLASRQTGKPVEKLNITDVRNVLRTSPKNKSK